MSKAIVSVSPGNFVVSLEDAVALSQIIVRSEAYMSKYRSGGTHSHHIYPHAGREVVEIKVITDTFYQVASMAGQPNE